MSYCGSSEPHILDMNEDHLCTNSPNFPNTQNPVPDQPVGDFHVLVRHKELLDMLSHDVHLWRTSKSSMTQEDRKLSSSDFQELSKLEAAKVEYTLRPDNVVLAQLREANVLGKHIAIKETKATSAKIRSRINMCGPEDRSLKAVLGELEKAHLDKARSIIEYMETLLE